MNKIRVKTNGTIRNRASYKQVSKATLQLRLRVLASIWRVVQQVKEHLAHELKIIRFISRGYHCQR